MKSGNSKLINFRLYYKKNAFHWISPKIKYVKTAAALQDKGYLILLWNLTPEPRYEIFQAPEEVYRVYTPSLFRYEGAEKQAEILGGFRQDIIDSGCFENLGTSSLSDLLQYR